MQILANVAEMWVFSRTVDGPRYLVLEASQEKADAFFGGHRFWQIPGTSMHDDGEATVDMLQGAQAEAGLRCRRTLGNRTCVDDLQPPLRCDPDHSGVRGRGLRLTGAGADHVPRFVTGFINPSRIRLVRVGRCTTSRKRAPDLLRRWPVTRSFGGTSPSALNRGASSGSGVAPTSCRSAPGCSRNFCSFACRSEIAPERAICSADEGQSTRVTSPMMRTASSPPGSPNDHV